jgi:NAD(P)-dependent dehydrogenase (short-subunit alcohol dehydrogenase family)
MQKQVVLITGCSEGGIGYGLAQEAARGKNTTVYASARSIERMQGLKACGCHLVALDVCWPQDKIAQV